jgi:propanediol dehydratase small subunit
MAEQNERYPLMEHAADRLRAMSGRRLADVTLDAAAAGELEIADIQIDAETLRAQGTIASQAGYPQLAANLTRAAELTSVPNADILRMYELLRPGRASYDELIELATRLAQLHQAPESAALVREAAEAYRARGLLRR